ncbi:Metal transporter CNNM4 (Ancient conserved domain-containing protein 4) (Cyclin-M4) [Durusdinium trenchii]|uniref:Metal transporter CNNM4 (Ancient conserved domain-containing protein 4) (Cyclin-M4) n=1 Tax=Durusdinium trenchii TaxID=1381693 RepID=A0ABP0MFE5_9DINO
MLPARARPRRYGGLALLTRCVEELMEMLKLQISLGAVSAEEGKIAQQVAEGALSFRDKQVGDIMTPLEDAYFLSSRTKLGYDAIREIFETGYSLLAELERGRGAEAVWSINDLKNNITTLQGRIPIYGMDKHDYRGLLYTKDNMKADLMLADPEDEMKVGDFIQIFNRKVETFFEETKLVQCLNAFKKGGTHMGLVRKVGSLL